VVRSSPYGYEMYVYSFKLFKDSCIFKFHVVEIFKHLRCRETVSHYSAISLKRKRSEPAVKVKPKTSIAP